MAEGLPGWVLIGAASDIVERGAGMRFPVRERYGRQDAQLTGFVVRFEGQLYAYLNQCAHVATELDWIPGQFFESSGLYLMCATHGAIYLPENGTCTGGPCRGARLRQIDIREHQGSVYWLPDDVLAAPNPPDH
jgi:nitrite reductase/ring-hydroxylating ferredoxin subunit